MPGHTVGAQMWTWFLGLPVAAPVGPEAGKLGRGEVMYPVCDHSDAVGAMQSQV